MFSSPGNCSNQVQNSVPRWRGMVKNTDHDKANLLLTWRRMRIYWFLWEYQVDFPPPPPPPFTLAPITMRKHGAYESGEDRNRRGMKVRDGTTNLSALGLAIFRSSFSCPTVDVWSKWRGKSALRRSLYSCAPRGRIAVCWSDPFKYHSGKGFVRKKNLLLNDRSRVDDFTITWGTHSD